MSKFDRELADFIVDYGLEGGITNCALSRQPDEDPELHALYQKLEAWYQEAEALLEKRGILGAFLDGLRIAIERGDSFEGQIKYTCLEPHLGPDEFEVTGAFRTGNSEGQGGMTILDHSLLALPAEEKP